MFESVVSFLPKYLFGEETDGAMAVDPKEGTFASACCVFSQEKVVRFFSGPSVRSDGPLHASKCFGL